MAYDIKRSNDAFVILHNASAVCSLAFWFLELQQYLARVLLPGEKFTSENTPALKSVWNDTVLKSSSSHFCDTPSFRPTGIQSLQYII